MWLELGALFHYLSSSLSVSAIVLSGSHPRAFTTGIDTTAFVSSPVFASSSTSSASKDPDKNLTGTDPARISHGIRSHITTFQASISAVSQCTKPVIAAIHGHCLGLGVDLTLCADVRFCSSDAKFAVKEVDIGLAADIGTLSRLPKLVGSGSWVFDVCLSGRTFGAEEAKREGFVNRVCEPGGRDVVVTEALSWAQDVASKSPVAVLGTKEILKWSWDRSVEDGTSLTLLCPPDSTFLSPWRCGVI